MRFSDLRLLKKLCAIARDTVVLFDSECIYHFSLCRPKSLRQSDRKCYANRHVCNAILHRFLLLSEDVPVKVFELY